MDYVTLANKAKAKDKPVPIVTDYIANCFIKIIRDAIKIDKNKGRMMRKDLFLLKLFIDSPKRYNQLNLWLSFRSRFSSSHFHEKYLSNSAKI